MFGNISGGGSGGSDKDGMHPDDLRNLLIFFVIAAVIYLAYDSFILRPQTEALRQQRVAQTKIEQTQQVEADKPLRPRAEILAETPRIAIDNGKISGTISLYGTHLDDLALDEYFETIEKKDKVMLLSPHDTEFPRHVAHGWIAEGNVKLPDDTSLWQVEGNNKLSTNNPVTLRWNNGQGLKFENTYAIDDNYMITLTQKVTNDSVAKVTLHSYGLVAQTGLRPNFAPVWIVHEGPIGYAGDALHQATYTSLWKEPSMQEFSGTAGWTGITDKYWLTSLIPPQGENVLYHYRYTGPHPTRRGQKDTGRYQADYTAAAVTVEPGKQASVESRIFVGAKKIPLLEEYEEKLNIPHFDLAVDFGWFWFMTKPFFFMLHFFELHSSIGIAMILMTIMLRMAAFPLTSVSYRSFAKMKKVSPQIAELRKIYGEDRAKLQTELVKLYEREGVNPMAGCFPMMIQIPIFFSLYKVLVTTIEMRQAPFFGWIHDMSSPDPTNVFTLFGLIHWDPPSFLHIGVWPCVMLVCMLIQRRLNPPPQDPIQRDMAIYFPFMMAYMMSRFASGLVIYWSIGGFLGLAQQIYIMRSLGVPIYLFGEQEAKLEKAIAAGPSVHPLIEMAEKNVEEAMFGDDDDDAPKTVSPPKPRRKKKK